MPEVGLPLEMIPLSGSHVRSGGIVGAGCGLLQMMRQAASQSEFTARAEFGCTGEAEVEGAWLTSNEGPSIAERSSPNPLPRFVESRESVT